MADYQLTSTPSSVIRNLDGATITNEPPNIHWQEYSNWLAMGNVPDPYTADISNRQFYHQLTVSGRLTQDQARTVMSGSLKKTPMQDVVDAQQPGDQFRYEMAFLAIKFERNEDAVEALREHFNLSPEYMDQIFLDAAMLEK